MLHAYFDEPQQTPKTALVMLHGFGSDGQDLISLAPALRVGMDKEISDGLLMASLDAPDVTPFGMGRQWFSDAGWTFKDKPGIEAAKQMIEGWVRAELVEKRGIDWDKIVVLGFSQGMMTATYAVPRFEHSVAGLIGLSGRMLWAEELEKDACTLVPTLLCHGTMDDVVPADETVAAAEKLKELGFEVEYDLFDGLGHGIDQRVAGRICVALGECLGNL